MMEAVIFDFGGVITESPFEAFNRLESARGLPKDFVRRINATNPHTNAWARFERSEIGLDGFDLAFADEARAMGFELPGREVLACLHGAVRPSMLEALRRISARFKTGCITNNVKSDNPASAWRNQSVDEAMGLFGHVIEFVEDRHSQTRPENLSHDGRSARRRPSRCIYLDDLGINLKPARDMGMTTIKVERADPALDTLETLLGLTLR